MVRDYRDHRDYRDSPEPDDRICHLCYDYGHLAFECPVREALFRLARMVHGLNMPLNTRITEDYYGNLRGNPRVVRHRHEVESRRHSAQRVRHAGSTLTIRGANSVRVGRRVPHRSGRQDNRNANASREAPRRDASLERHHDGNCPSESHDVESRTVSMESFTAAPGPAPSDPMDANTPIVEHRPDMPSHMDISPETSNETFYDSSDIHTVTPSHSTPTDGQIEPAVFSDASYDDFGGLSNEDYCGNGLSLL